MYSGCSAMPRSVSAGLQRQLHDASLAKQRHDGRVVLRRLNRIEYETTLRDLLGTQVEVKDLLPDDNISAGFDNVSAVLDVSSAHLLRYQQAAEKSLRSVIPTRPFQDFKEQRSGRVITEKMATWRELLGKTARLDGDTLVMNGDELRRVHWRSTARYGELMVRREEQRWRNRALLLLDTRRISHYGTGMASSFEFAVSAAASVGVHVAREGLDGELITDEGSLDCGGAFEDILLDTLAVRGVPEVYLVASSATPLPKRRNPSIEHTRSSVRPTRQARCSGVRTPNFCSPSTA